MDFLKEGGISSPVLRIETMDIAKLKEYFPPDAPDLEIEQQTFRDQVTGYLHQILESSNQNMGVTPAAVTKLLSGDRNL